MSSTPQAPTLADIQAARDRIRDALYESPLAHSITLSERCGCAVHLKLENLQMTGAFKERGALNRLLQLTTEETRRGVIVASAGNHALGVAYHGARLGVPVTVVMPVNAPLKKVQGLRDFGAEVVLHGDDFEEALEEALRRAAAGKLAFIHPFNDTAVMAGQGTLALEILEQCPDVEAIIVPVGGGGLITGIATGIKALRPATRIIGVECAAVPAAAAARRAGKPVLIDAVPTIADGIANRIISDATATALATIVDDLVIVEEDEIAAAILTLLEDEKTVAEGAGAAPLAALIHRDLGLAGRRVVLVVSGGNIDVSLLNSIIDLGRVKSGRLLQLRVVLRDRPGELKNLAGLFADHHANIVQIHHTRSVGGLRIGETQVAIHLETRGFDHIAELRAALAQAGYEVHRADSLA